MKEINYVLRKLKAVVLYFISLKPLKLLCQLFYKTTGDIDTLKLLSNEISRTNNEINNLIRKAEAENTPLPEIFSWDSKSRLQTYVMCDNPPWEIQQIRETDIQGMISIEERKYYSYIGKFYSGVGNVVEIGPWLGCSTFYILDGLLDNPNFSDKKLYVYDDFVWREWMNSRYNGNEKFNNHQDFKKTFDNNLNEYKDNIIADKRKVITHNGNEDVPLIEWDGDPIEIIYVDVGRTFEANEGWYRIFSDNFIPNKTIIIMQDYRVHLDIPVMWFNQTKEFVESKGSQLQLIHELSKGCIAAFLYKDIS